MQQTVVILDFGGQYNQLIARRVRELNVYCELLPYNTDIQKIKSKNPIGIIFTGGPNSVYGENAPVVSKEIFSIAPVFGICYGCQLIAKLFEGEVVGGAREYGKQTLKGESGKIFKGIPSGSVCWMSHTDYIDKLPKGFKVTAKTDTCPVVAMENESKKFTACNFIRRLCIRSTACRC